MTKPDDIRIPADVDAEVWRSAAEAMASVGWYATSMIRGAYVAIMAAKAEEREAVKHWLTREAEINDELETQIVEADGKGWHKHFADVQRRNVDAIDAGRHVEKYAATLKSGDVNTAHNKNISQEV